MKKFRSRLLSITVMVLAFTAVAADPTAQTAHSENTDNLTGSHASMVAQLRKSIPKGWTVEVQPGNVPFGHDKQHAFGTTLAFKGTQRSKFVGRKEELQGTEHFTIWLMPLDYVPEVKPVDPGNAGAFFAVPENIGSNTICQVYCLTSIESQPTWPDWKQDVKRLFGLEPTPRQGGRRPSHLQCIDVKECVLVGVLSTDKGPVYKLKLSANDPKTYFVRAGDSVGDYLLTDQKTTAEGKAKVVLMKGTETIDLSETGVDHYKEVTH